MTGLVRLRRADGTTAWAVERAGERLELDCGLGDLLALPVAAARELVEAASRPLPSPDGWTPAAPVDEQEVWACGVTYQRSRQGREEESASGALYTQVYEAERPEIFFKSVPWRVVGDGGDVGIRRDSAWNVPEAELGLVVSSRGEIFGYVPGNDMSSRSIEGENPLYLPQAKVYTGACALGPRIVPAWEVRAPFEISVQVTRDGRDVFTAHTSTSTMHRTLEALVDWAMRAMDFPRGLVLLTGTGLVPTADVTLHEGDEVVVHIGGLGTLTNRVTEVGRTP